MHNPEDYLFIKVLYQPLYHKGISGKFENSQETNSYTDKRREPVKLYLPVAYLGKALHFNDTTTTCSAATMGGYSSLVFPRVLTMALMQITSQKTALLYTQITYNNKLNIFFPFIFKRHKEIIE